MFDYFCIDCGKQKPKNAVRGMICLYCGGDLRGECASVSGTRDGFGITKSFTDEKTGKEIDTWKKWEKAGYGTEIKNHDMKEKVKEQLHKRKDRQEKKLDNSSLPI